VKYNLAEKDEILANLNRCVVEGNDEECKKWAEEAIKSNLDAYEAIVKGCAEGMKIVSDKFEKHEYYVPEVLIAAEAMNAAVEVLKPHVKVEEVAVTGTVVLGVVEGDVHDIGKNLVKLMLETAGFTVKDLGKDVSVDKFIEAVKETKAQIVGMSSLMTTTMPNMEQVVKELEKHNLRSGVKITIGGAPTSLEYCKKIGADGWAKDASGAVNLAQKLVSELK
jgi:dimethylamine corrinoid protein